MNTSRVAPAARASSTAYWMSGLSTTGSISFGLALVAGKKRVPRPATGNTAVRIGDFKLIEPSSSIYGRASLERLAEGRMAATGGPETIFSGFFVFWDPGKLPHCCSEPLALPAA